MTVRVLGPSLCSLDGRFSEIQGALIELNRQFAQARAEGRFKTNFMLCDESSLYVFESFFVTLAAAIEPVRFNDAFRAGNATIVRQIFDFLSAYHGLQREFEVWQEETNVASRCLLSDVHESKILHMWVVFEQAYALLHEAIRKNVVPADWGREEYSLLASKIDGNSGRFSFKLSHLSREGLKREVANRLMALGRKEASQALATKPLSDRIFW